MNRKTSQRIASIGLFLFGIFELMGLIMLLAPKEYLPSNFETQSVFWALLSGIYGISRIVAGYAIWSNKKWGFVFGLLLCLATMIVAPTIIPFGIIDLILAVVITVSLLYTYYGNEKMLQA
jgi:uncharacterized membrane protein (DUF2068 family)